MDAAEKKLFEIRVWAIETLQAGERRGEGRAALNREAIARLDACHELNAPPPEELIAVIARQLKVAGKVRNQTHLKQQQMLAAFALAREPLASCKKLARQCGVGVPTITRWRKSSQFNKAVEELRELSELEPVLRELFPWQEGSHRSPTA
ncbi:MAG: hypothetical protein WCC97_18655 [Candidatus Acidiferrales bacterium]